MIVAGLLFATMAVFVKLGAGEFDAAELAFYRSFVGMLFVVGMLAINEGSVRSRHLRYHVIRSVVGSISLIGYFYAIAQLPIATAQTLNYTSPLFLAIVTTVVLGEKFSPWLMVAIAGGFAGVGMLLQPNFASGTEGAALV